MESSSSSSSEEGASEEFLRRQLNLERKLEKTRDPRTNQYNGKASIKKLKEYLKEANCCFKNHSVYDDGILTTDYDVLADQRRMNGIVSSDPPSQMKVLAWGGVKIAKITLAEAYERHETKENLEEAIKLYESLVNLALRARMEIWESDSQLHIMMMNLGLCLKRNGQYEKAHEWYTKADRMCSKEDPNSQVHEAIRHNMAVMMQEKAGPSSIVNSNNRSAKKEWKRCWACNSKESNTVKMLRCSKCFELKFATPAYYCGTECQRNDWPRHKVFHRTMKEKAKHTSNVSFVKEEDKDILTSNNNDNDNDHDHDNDQPSSYEELLKQAAQCMERKDMKSARRKFEKAIKLDPDNPLAHHNIAIIFGDSGNYPGAVREYIETVRLIEMAMMAHMMEEADGGVRGDPDDFAMELWARSVISTHAIYRDNGGAVASVPRPKFLLEEDDDELELMMKCAKQATEIVPGYNESWAMLARAHELRGTFSESVKFYKKAARKSEQEANKTRFLNDAGRVEMVMMRGQKE